MGAIGLENLPEQALLLVDSSPIIYVLENRPDFAPRYSRLFEAHEEGRLHLAITTVTVAEVLTGPMRSGDKALERRYRTVIDSWRTIPFDFAIAESAARLRASLNFKLPDAIQAASALAINADALVTHDRDFSRLKALRIIS